MTTQEIIKIAESEMKKDGHLSQGVRMAVVSAAKAGDSFTISASTTDAIKIGQTLRRASYKGVMKQTTIEDNIKHLHFN